MQDAQNLIAAVPVKHQVVSSITETVLVVIATNFVEKVGTVAAIMKITV